MADTEERSIEEILADIKSNQLALAKAQQPILSEIVGVLQSSDIANALDTLKRAGAKLASSSTVNVQINNFCTQYANLSAAVSREAVALNASVTG